MLLDKKARSGRPRVIPDWAEVALQKRLQEPQRFDSYQEICNWLESKLGIAAKYKTVHQLVHYRIHSSPKMPLSEAVERSLSGWKHIKKLE